MNYDELPASPELDRLVAEMMGEDIAVLPEHQWRKNERGEIDKAAMDCDPHNGPCCARCGESYCVHCRDKPSATCAPTVMPYCTAIMHAWGALESKALDDADGFRRWYFTITETALGFNVDGHHKDDDGTVDKRVRATGEKAPLAICRAVLKAVAL